jgi:hypothetical protein
MVWGKLNHRRKQSRWLAVPAGDTLYSPSFAAVAVFWRKWRSGG